MQALLLAALLATSAARARAGAATPTPPPAAAVAAPTPVPTSETATAGAHDASSTPPADRTTRPPDFVPSPQLEPGSTGADVDGAGGGWLVSSPPRQPPPEAGKSAAAGLPQHTGSASHAASVSHRPTGFFEAPSPKHQESEFRPMAHHLLHGSVLPETPGGVSVHQDESDPVQLYLDAMKSQLRHQNDRPHTVTASSKFHGGREHAHAYLEDTSGARQGGQATVSSSDHRSVHDYLKTAQADFAGLEQQQQQEGDFPAVWGESKVSGKPVRFEEDASGTQAVVVGGARGSGAFPYQYEQPAGSIPEVVVPSTVGKKHHGRKKMGVARPSPRSGLVQKVLHALAAFIPLGLFLASIQPSVITVNSSAPAPGVSRQRSVVGGSSDELLAAGAGADCEARLLCEAAVRGRLEAADAPERALWLAAHQTPDKMAVALGLYDVLKAIRTGTCDLYSCRAMQDEPFGSPT